MMLSDACLSVVYIGPKSRTERPRKTKTGTEVVHVTHDSDITFKVKVTGAGAYCGGLQYSLLSFNDTFSTNRLRLSHAIEVQCNVYHVGNNTAINSTVKQ